MSRRLVFIVAYNHQDKIAGVIARVPPSLMEDPGTEILVIDDASGDSTFAISDALRDQLAGRARLTVLKNPVNQGYGGNQKLGYRYAIDHGFTHVFLLHGDGQYAPECLTEFVAAYDQSSPPDAVFGTRMSSWSAPLRGGMPLYKFVGNRILTAIQNRLLRTSFSEFHSGYRSYSIDLLKRIPFEANSNGFDFDTEIFIQCIAAGARLIELPIPTYYGDEICYVNGLRYAWDVVAASLRYRVQDVGFLYDRKFDVGAASRYPRKRSRFSSHSKIAAAVPSGARVLDIGCGAGNIAAALVQKGCVVDGIDVRPAGEIDAPLRSYFQIDLSRDLDAVARVLDGDAYDHVILADVLEHLPEPERLVDVIRIRHRASRTPLVIASTGNVAFLPVRAMLAIGQFNYGTRGILDRTHRVLFTRRSFRHLFEQWGFAILAQEGIGMPISSMAGSAESRLANTLEWIGDALARAWPSLCAYQILLQVRPLPTAQQLLEQSSDYSKGLRDGRSNVRISA